MEPWSEFKNRHKDRPTWSQIVEERYGGDEESVVEALLDGDVFMDTDELAYIKDRMMPSGMTFRALKLIYNKLKNIERRLA